ncbi:chromosome transmission fidelity protein 8 homolog isoform X2 [Hylaeus anthracinus]|uniref:chromosome transmission fidelity protein 8 homolog isoform X2 n=1 Tax=Hylaeus anthracinus TaxID=313031 RepID=UPI0023B960CB|nr:chromosome transmission fidelity protein 8 homolog isoform X2 [Hylaeus anthracinus]
MNEKETNRVPAVLFSLFYFIISANITSFFYRSKLMLKYSRWRHRRFTSGTLPLNCRLYSIVFSAQLLIYRQKDGELEEWAIIELQGDLKFASSDTSNKYIGDLHFTKSGTPILIIGIHVLHGKEVGLTKPFAVLQKKKNEIDATANESEIKIEYIVKAIVTKKLVFRSRPKPIVRNVPKFS